MDIVVIEVYTRKEVKYATALKEIVGEHKYKKITKITEITKDGFYILEE